MLSLIIAITVSYLIVLIGTVLMIFKVEKSELNNKVISGFAIALIALLIVYEPFRNSVYSYFIMIGHFLLSLSYGLYVFSKLKGKTESSI